MNYNGVGPDYGGGGQQQQQVVVITQQPTQKGHIPHPEQGREWTTGMCGCFEDCCGCVYACLCFPCFMCTLASKMNECQLGPCCFGNLFTIPMRTRLRTLYNIRGSICKDLCALTFCEFCVVLQMLREMKNMQQMI